MKSLLISEGHGRTKVTLSTHLMGSDPIICIFNECAHLGAVAVADYCREENQASTSVITRLGHRDDSVARDAAYKLCKRLKEPVCVIAGIHLDDITDEEIAQIIQNCDKLVDRLSRSAAGRE